MANNGRAKTTKLILAIPVTPTKKARTADDSASTPLGLEGATVSRKGRSGSRMRGTSGKPRDPAIAIAKVATAAAGMPDRACRSPDVNSRTAPQPNARLTASMVGKVRVR